MTDEELLYFEIREDRRLIELGLDPTANPLALWGQLSEMLEEIKRRERNAEKTLRPHQAESGISLLIQCII